MKVKWYFVLFGLLGFLLAACNNGETAVSAPESPATQSVDVAPDSPTEPPELEATATVVATEPATEPVAEDSETNSEVAEGSVAATLVPSPTIPIPVNWLAEDVVFVANDGLEIQTTFFGLRDGPPQPGVILLHMLGGSRKVWEQNDFAALLADSGYAVLTVDMRGHGDTRGQQDWEAVEADLQQIWTEFTEWGEVDGSRTAVIGGSIGSSMALITGDNHPTISTVVLLSPGIEYLGVPIDERILTYGQRPMLIVASEEDTYSADSSRALHRVAQDAELIMYEGAGHGTQMFGAEPTLSTAILSWLNAHLGGGSMANSSVASQDVEFATADDHTLQGTLFGSGGMGVIFANMNDNQSLPWQSFAQEVAAEGYMTLTFEYRSAGRFGMGERDDDLLAAAHFMQAQGAESLVIIGASIGGTATAVVASEHQEVLNLQGISIIASPAGVPDLIVRDAMIQAITVPKLFITTEDDEQGLAVATERMFETAVEPKEFQTYPGTAHGVDIFATESDLAFRQRLLQFVQMVMPITE